MKVVEQAKENALRRWQCSASSRQLQPSRGDRFIHRYAATEHLVRALVP